MTEKRIRSPGSRKRRNKPPAIRRKVTQFRFPTAPNKKAHQHKKSGETQLAHFPDLQTNASEQSSSVEQLAPRQCPAQEQVAAGVGVGVGEGLVPPPPPPEQEAGALLNV